MPLPADIVLWSLDAENADGWSAHAATGSQASVTRVAAEAGSALRFDFTLAGHGAFAIARCEAHVTLPAHPVVVLRLRGDASPAELQIKLVDAEGANVWWWRRPRYRPLPEGERLLLRRASLRFAWGPRSGGDPAALGAVEVAVASDDGAAGTLWIEDLRIEAREAPAGPLHAHSVRASSAAPGHPAQAVLAADAPPDWRPAPGDALPWLELDLGARCEWGGLLVVLAEASEAPRCRVLSSEDGTRWSPLLEEQLASARSWLRTGEAESRFVRVELPGGLRGGISHIAIVPIELAVSPARFAAAAARAAPRGRLPRHLLGEHGYWALVAAESDERKGLLGADGALEIEAEGFTLEPFLRDGTRLLTWADVESSASLEAGALPIPSVTWTAPALSLRTTAFAVGDAGQSALVVRYVVTNAANAVRDVQLVVAIRPFQVTPEWQSLGLVPAVSPITRLVREGAAVRVNETRTVVAVTAPDAIDTAAPGSGPGAFLEARLEALVQAEDPLGFAEAALGFELRLAPGAAATVVLALPLHEATPAPPAGLSHAEAAAWCETQLAGAVARWTARLAQVPVELPPRAAPVFKSLRASLAWVLVNREGPRIQPGPRCYRRSWIRDGALTGAALAEMGFAAEAGAFLRWYAPFQSEDGRVPCAVDRHGIDRAVEHDSHGELIWGVVELWRLTTDEAFLRALWPRVKRAAEAIAALRAERTGEGYLGDPRFGLLPESISHEGYSSQPVHAFWDDFFALRGLADAADAAGALGDAAAQARFGSLRDDLRRDLHASLAATMARHGLDVLPGSVELGDFDPTSTAIAFDPCGEDARLPRAALERTFERYWREYEARRRGDRPWDAYTAYEIRNATALSRLGWKERALALLDAMIADQRPPGWRQWPEVSTRDPRAPRFLGDLPHGWVASGFVRSVRRLLADERREDGTLLVAAGVPESWVHDGDGVRLRALPTIFGPLDLHLRAEEAGRVRASFGGSCRPPGGIVLFSPLARPLREVWTDGQRGHADRPDRVSLRTLPREVLLVY